MRPYDDDDDDDHNDDDDDDAAIPCFQCRRIHRRSDSSAH